LLLERALGGQEIIFPRVILGKIRAGTNPRPPGNIAPLG
jgi:hypothetical protein